MAKIWVIEDDKIMTECLVRAIQNTLPKSHKTIHPKHQIATFSNAIDAIGHLNDEVPDIILLDILLSGPDGFTFLNELISYHDTINIPVIVVTSLEFAVQNLEHYNIVDILRKETMTPAEIIFAIERALKNAQ